MSLSHLAHGLGAYFLDGVVFIKKLCESILFSRYMKWHGTFLQIPLLRPLEGSSKVMHGLFPSYQSSWYAAESGTTLP